MRMTGLNELDSGSRSVCVMTEVMWQNPDHSEVAEQESRVVETNNREREELGGNETNEIKRLATFQLSKIVP